MLALIAWSTAVDSTNPELPETRLIALPGVAGRIITLPPAPEPALTAVPLNKNESAESEIVLFMEEMVLPLLSRVLPDPVRAMVTPPAPPTPPDRVTLPLLVRETVALGPLVLAVKPLRSPVLLKLMLLRAVADNVPFTTVLSAPTFPEAFNERLPEVTTPLPLMSPDVA